MRAYANYSPILVHSALKTVHLHTRFLIVLTLLSHFDLQLQIVLMSR